MRPDKVSEYLSRWVVNGRHAILEDKILLCSIIPILDTWFLGKRHAINEICRILQIRVCFLKAWGALAEHLKGISTFGKAAEMTAHNAFVRINANREMAGEGMLVDAPDYRCDVPEVDWDAIWVTPVRVLFTGIENPTGTYKLVVKMSAGQGVGISKGWNKTVIITPGMADDWGDAGLTQLYTKKIGFMPEVGEKVFIELY